ncbi:GntR family transcriptional regulator [Nocardia otitidiscaviarum]|uniref:GntR family transcriptional regulator n=1 Tax=Nocardia otitidiscaviarum TaxID=1823 RepID=UPI0020CD61FF|nr:GntR family transcriptional regulator [Nocardia otitidiscaviarum]MCP9625244.1 GntR family transcriptional regulator [Nocardia otitidiscaviarum]
MPPPSRWKDIADDLRGRIKAGEWQPGDQLPTSRQLMDHYEVSNPNVVNRAVAALRAEGLLVADPKAPRRGVRVRAQHFFQRELDAYRQEYREAMAGRTHSFEKISRIETGVEVDITYEVIDPPEEVAETLGTTKKVLHRTFTYLADGTPHQVSDSYMAVELAQRIGLKEPSDERPGRTTIAWLLAAGIDVTRTSTTLRARIPSPDESARMATAPGVPIFVHRHTLYAGDTAVETGGGLVAADQIEYTMSADLTKEV